MLCAPQCTVTRSLCDRKDYTRVEVEGSSFFTLHSKIPKLEIIHTIGAGKINMFMEHEACVAPPGGVCVWCSARLCFYSATDFFFRFFEWNVGRLWLCRLSDLGQDPISGSTQVT